MFKSIDFYNNLNTVCNQQGIVISKAVKECGGSAKSPTAWKNGAVPKCDIVVSLSQKLGISADFLLGLAPPQNNTFNGDISGGAFVQGINNGTVAVTHSGQELRLSAEANELVNIYEKLDIKQRHKLMDLAFKLEDEK